MAGEPIIDCTLGELAAQIRNALVGGPFGSDLVSKDYVPNGVPVIRGTNMGHGRWVDGEFAYVTTEKAESLSSNCAKPGDIVFTQRGTLGQVALVPKKGAGRYLISQSQMKLTVDAEKADAMFLYYVFTSAEQQDYIRQNAIQTGVPHTNLGILRNTPLTLPPLAEQKAIAAVLGALDDKIELNRRMNATLEAMARALFQSWFIDFDPVRANMDRNQPSPRPSPTGRGRNAAEGEVAAGLGEGRFALDPATAALFPDSFQDSSLGPIPYGWKVKPLSELTTLITKGTTPTKGDMTCAPDSDAKINYVRVNSIDEDGSVLADKLTSIPESVHAGVLKRSILRSHDVLYTIAGTIGRIALAEDWVLPANTNQAVAIIRPALDIPSGFLILTMRHEVFREELHNNIVHAVQANLSLGMLSKSRAVVPPKSTLQKLFKPIDEILSHISANRSQNHTLATLRDTLLPKLLSGELRPTQN